MISKFYRCLLSENCALPAIRRYPILQLLTWWCLHPHWHDSCSAYNLRWYCKSCSHVFYILLVHRSSFLKCNSVPCCHHHWYSALPYSLGKFYALHNLSGLHLDRDPGLVRSAGYRSPHQNMSDLENGTSWLHSLIVHTSHRLHNLAFLYGPTHHTHL